MSNRLHTYTNYIPVRHKIRLHKFLIWKIHINQFCAFTKIKHPFELQMLLKQCVCSPSQTESFSSVLCETVFSKCLLSDLNDKIRISLSRCIHTEWKRDPGTGAGGKTIVSTLVLVQVQCETGSIICFLSSSWLRSVCMSHKVN